MPRLGCLTLLLAGSLAILLPLLVRETFEASLWKLGIPPDLALVYFLAMLAGSAVDIPLRRSESPRYLRADPLAILGLEGLLPHLGELRRQTVLAVNAGGCLIPLGIAAYEVVRLAALEHPARALIALLIAVLVNAVVCWKLARPVAGVGIALPGLVPALVAAASALLLQSDLAPPVALVAGVLGPLIGANLLHLRDLKATPVALASVGGAGTFDGIVLAGVVATVLG
ncbi:MAG: DUF1614 domain-containing protein [Planctomycetes bacterium]|nr:DUF1614 domain-containing protein [Planctomycetota bacterium]